MARDEHHLLADYIVCCRNRLLRVARIVGDDQIELLAEYSALGVDVGNGHFGAARHLLAESGVRAGDRPDHRDGDILRFDAAGAERERHRQDDAKDKAVHETLPPFGMRLRASLTWPWAERTACRQRGAVHGCPPSR